MFFGKLKIKNRPRAAYTMFFCVSFWQQETGYCLKLIDNPARWGAS